jgi:hypothetical protein
MKFSLPVCLSLIKQTLMPTIKYAPIIPGSFFFHFPVYTQVLIDTLVLPIIIFQSYQNL